MVGQKNKNHILLVDGENILHQSFHKFEKLKSTDGKPSGAIFGFFKSLHMYLTRFNPDDVYISFDCGKRSDFRTKLVPEYKSHRKNISIDYESLQTQKRIIIKILGMLRIKYIFDKKKTTNYEGDDFLAYLILNNLNTKSKITLVSSDKDFNQLLDGNRVKIFNPRKEEIVYESNCMKLFGYEAKETVDYLSMVGDKSDDISGFPGIGPVKARKILDEYGNLLSFVQKNPKYEEIYLRNQKMIDLRVFINQNYILPDRLPIKVYRSNGIKYTKFKELCIDYSFSSFMTNEFIEPFKNLLICEQC